jgi:hypothetical protein
MVRSTRSTGVAVLLMLVLVGCATARATGDDVAGSRGELRTLVREISLDLAVVEDAAEPLVASCMAAAGFEHQPVGANAHARAASGSATEVQIAVGLLRAAHEHNERKARSLSEPQRRAHEVVMMGDPGDRRSVTSAGGIVRSSPAGGCLAGARAQVLGSVDAHLRLSALLGDAEMLSAPVGSNARALSAAVDRIGLDWRALRSERIDALRAAAGL